MFDLGPSWAWVLILLMAILGVLASIAGAICGIVWVVRHISFV